VGERRSAATATATTLLVPVATGTALDAYFRSGFGEPSLHRGVTRALEPHHHVIRELLAFGLAPARGKQVLQPAGRGLPQLVRAGDADIHPLVHHFSVVRHRRKSLAGRSSGLGASFSTLGATPISEVVSGRAAGDAMLEAAASVSSWLSADGDWVERLEEVLAHLGEAASADRAFVYRNCRDDSGRLWMELVSDWSSPATASGTDDPAARSRPYAPVLSRWIETLGGGNEVRARLSDLPDVEARWFGSRQVRAVVAVPVFCGTEWWGYLGLEDRHAERVWSDVVADALRTTSASLGSSLQRALEEDTKRLSDDGYRSMVEAGPAVSYIDAADGSASTVYISPQVESMLGYTPQEWIADPDLWSKVLHPDDRDRALAENRRHNETGEPFRMEYRMFHRDGSLVWIHDEAVMVRGERGAPGFSHGVLMDVSERKRDEVDMAFNTYHDELTGLPSRSMFDELLELSIARAARQDRSVAVLCVDIDDFRLANDSLGHEAGDELLRMVAARLREASRETDLVARRGGDQFLMLLSDLARDPGDMDTAVVRAEATAQRVHDAMAEPFTVGTTELYVSVSLGLSLFPQDAPEGGVLQHNAEAAMYESKKSGPGGYVVSSRGAFDSSAKLQFVTRLRKAVAAQRWTLHYQPVVDLASGSMRGVEALIRWIEPDGTMVPPSEFIPLSEELGLIEAIGDWVVRELVYQANAWRELGLDLEIGFNLSPRQFWQPDLAQRIVKQIRSGGVDPSTIVVEITEGSAMVDPDRAQEILWELNDSGLRIAIDDFGTGYSSLSRLREMPVHVLKIDRSFVSGVEADPQSASIVGAFLDLSRGLGITTLAEGIETEGELNFLRDRGCELGQGFLFAKAVPPEEIIAFALAGVPVPGVVSEKV
jgi:diguanylate cyclase (GGDEF)-like protein/PAS domain S-box-containing protein